MDENDLQQSDFINANERFSVPKVTEPRVDMLISSIVGKKIYALDPRVIQLVIKYKRLKKNDDEPDTFLQNPRFIQELKTELNKSL